MELEISKRKCRVIEFGSEGRNQWVLRNNVLQVEGKYVHLGLKVSKEGIRGEKQKNKRRESKEDGRNDNN